ncbi:MAG: hypothetical protein WD830_10075 [Chloroflexota bacterium]
MSKSIVTRLFVGGIVAVIAGLFLTIAAVLIAYFSGAFILNGPDVTGLQPTPQAWTFVVLALVGVLSLIGGAIAGLVAWIGALLNTAQLEDKTWFILLLVLGLLSFGFVAMVAYVIAGPDGTRRPYQQNHPIYT